MKFSERTALLVVDMVNPFDFEDGEAHARAAISIAPAIGRLKKKARAAVMPGAVFRKHHGENA